MPRRRESRGDPARLELNLTPLLDVVLQLIAFFMMLVHFGTQIQASATEVRLPVAPAVLPTGSLGTDQLVVVIDAEGALRVGNQALRGPAAQEWWAEQARDRIRGQASLGETVDELATRVIVRADRNAPYGSVRSALEIAQENRFASFTLVVLRRQR